MRYVGGLCAVVSSNIYIFEIERFRWTATSVREAGESHVMEVDCAESSRPRPGYIGSCLEDVELCSQSGGKIALGHLESFVCSLHILRLGLEHAFGLLKIDISSALN